jgi:hypothetical protein
MGGRPNGLAVENTQALAQNQALRRAKPKRLLVELMCWAHNLIVPRYTQIGNGRLFKLYCSERTGGS